MATHSSVLAWRIPGTGEPGGLPSMGSHRVGHDWKWLRILLVLSVYFFSILSVSSDLFNHPVFWWKFKLSLIFHNYKQCYGKPFYIFLLISRIVFLKEGSRSLARNFCVLERLTMFSLSPPPAPAIFKQLGSSMFIVTEDGCSKSEMRRRRCLQGLWFPKAQILRGMKKTDKDKMCGRHITKDRRTSVLG